MVFRNRRGFRIFPQRGSFQRKQNKRQGTVHVCGDSKSYHVRRVYLGSPFFAHYFSSYVYCI